MRGGNLTERFVAEGKLLFEHNSGLASLVLCRDLLLLSWRSCTLRHSPWTREAHAHPSSLRLRPHPPWGLPPTTASSEPRHRDHRPACGCCRASPSSRTRTGSPAPSAARFQQCSPQLQTQRRQPGSSPHFVGAMLAQEGPPDSTLGWGWGWGASLDSLLHLSL